MCGEGRGNTSITICETRERPSHRARLKSHLVPYLVQSKHPQSAKQRNRKTTTRLKGIRLGRPNRKSGQSALRRTSRHSDTSDRIGPLTTATLSWVVWPGAPTFKNFAPFPKPIRELPSLPPQVHGVLQRQDPRSNLQRLRRRPAAIDYVKLPLSGAETPPSRRCAVLPPSRFLGSYHSNDRHDGARAHLGPHRPGDAVPWRRCQAAGT